MPLALTLLDGVRWNGEPVVGERPQALLAALASARRVVRPGQLVGEIWGDNPPANAGKALQVLVSRTRAACDGEVVVRDGDGYRLGIAAESVDSSRLADLAAAARVAFERDPATAVWHATEALQLGSALIAPGDSGGPLAALRRDAEDDLRTASLALARAQSRLGEHAEALPTLESAMCENPDDEGLFAELLRSESAVRGPATALARFERYRRELRNRLGAEPGVELRRLQVELLAAESPVRAGVRFEATELLGREPDVHRLFALLRTARVVSILGPGGLGKTRLAHVIGRGATQPVVHFVELVGVSAPDDLIGEVGSALGVRDSVSGRRALTPEQRADVRARIAQQLDQAPSLLILDNCEHIITAVADLVAYLVGTTRTARVLTTTRSPLLIAAETVYPLSELSIANGVELFRQRAVAARPHVQMDAAVAQIVERLDGLPLAIELAAAKVRVMSTADIARRLENRFALLRGGDRSAPDRHQTLLAVIDWSWNLLADPERHALRWLSVFHDGFTLGAAEAMLGPAALDIVETLTEQSLLSVTEPAGEVRYRMLETVREFGRMQLVAADEDGAAHEAHRTWAVDLCRLHGCALFGVGQLAAIDAIRGEEGNLSDVLRRAVLSADPATLVQLLRALGGYWAIRGDHARFIVLVDAIVDTVRGWVPPLELEDDARAALVLTLNHSMIGSLGQTSSLREILRAMGPGDEPRIAAMVRVGMAVELTDLPGFLAAMEDFARGSDRYLALMAEQMRSHALENSGDPGAAVDAAEHALSLVEASDGPWMAAILHTQIAQLSMHLGDREKAVLHARETLPTMERLGAHDDALQLRSLLVLAAIAEGDLDRAARELERLGTIDDTEAIFGGHLVIYLGEAELALALGDLSRGLDLYRVAVDRMRELVFPGMDAIGSAPWLLFGESTALTAFAYYAPRIGETPDGSVIGAEMEFAAPLDRSCLSRLAAVLDPDSAYLDYPVCGLVLFALGSWRLLRGVGPVEDAVRLLVLARRFAYNRTVPTMAWERIAPIAEARAPGLLERLDEEYGDRRGPDLLDEARRTVEQLS